MTTSPVMSVNDELVAELEALASECGQHGTNWYEPRHMAAFPEYACDQDFVVAASPATLLALLSERAELIRDRERLEWLITKKATIAEQNGTGSPKIYRVCWPFDYSCKTDWHKTPREAIDDAMQESKP